MNKINIYKLKEAEKVKIKEIIHAIIEYLVKYHRTDGISLDYINISPCQVMEILDDLGYKRDEDWDSNGWQGDCWWYFNKGDEHLCLFYSGYYFTMTLSLQE